VSLAQIILRSLQKKCPSCGQHGIFLKGWTLRDRCPGCKCTIAEREDDTYFFMYMSTAAITGLFVILMLLFPPENKNLGRAVVFIAAVLVFFVSNPYRKSIAIGLDYWIENKVT